MRQPPLTAKDRQRLADPEVRTLDLKGSPDEILASIDAVGQRIRQMRQIALKAQCVEASAIARRVDWA
jgi:hypothetical protein